MTSEALPVGASARASAPDSRRCLELALAALWLLDALLQLQAVMFTGVFARMIAEAATGNPAFVAGPVRWTAQQIAARPALSDSAFAALQLAIGLGIAWRPARRVALAASVAWSVAIWWLGEGLGGLLAGGASPVTGAPGPALLCALAAVLLWPPRPGPDAAFPAAGRVGAAAARFLWLALWGGLAVCAAQSGPVLGSAVSAASAGQPGWLASADQHLGRYLAGHGTAAAMLLATVLGLVAAGVYLPAPAARAVVGLALATAAVLWLGQGLGGILAGGATDPSSGPLLALLALCYWPRRQPRVPAEWAA